MKRVNKEHVWNCTDNKRKDNWEANICKSQKVACIASTGCQQAATVHSPIPIVHIILACIQVESLRKKLGFYDKALDVKLFEKFLDKKGLRAAWNNILKI